MHSHNISPASISLHNQVVFPASHTPSFSSTTTDSLNLHSSNASESLTASRASESLDTLASSTSDVISSSPQPFNDNPASLTQYLIPVDPDFKHENLQVVLHVPMNVHHMQTRSKNGIFKMNTLSASLSSSQDSITKPKTFRAASHVLEWQAAMKEEISALHTQKTWSLVLLPPDKNLVGCKWVYQIKRDANGCIARYKARLVAKGYSQE
ncbi:hypothetical protein PS2_006259 [Malus domestica]